MKNLAEMFQIRIGEPITALEYTIYPLFNQGKHAISYIPLAEAFRRSADNNNSFVIKEVSEAGSVNQLIVINGLDSCVLILDGEQLKGAKQNRAINITSLIGAGNKVIIPVSCIERGRWHGQSTFFDMKDSDLDMPGDVRSSKLEGVVEKFQKDFKRGIDPHFSSDQHEVWKAIFNKHLCHRVQSKTGSMTHISRSERFREANKIASMVPLLENQAGILVFRKNVFLGMEYISAPRVFEDNFKTLLNSY
ncbi:MAG: ARPP-1 family domain-containing protein [Bacteroidales bacterium]